MQSALVQVGTTAARAFLHGRGIPTVPHGPAITLSAEERLCRAYEHLAIQGGYISMRRLRQAAQVGMQLAHAFLAMRRTYTPHERQGCVSASCETMPAHPF